MQESIAFASPYHFLHDSECGLIEIFLRLALGLVLWGWLGILFHALIISGSGAESTPIANCKIQTVPLPHCGEA